MLEKILEMIANELHMEIDEVTADVDIIEDLGADSLSIVTILMTIEDTYGVTIPDDVVAELKTPRLLAEYIEKNI